MLVIPGRYGKDTCDGYSRRALLRVGSSALAGLSAATLLEKASGAAPVGEEEARYGGKGFGAAKSVIMLYLQGGPSHLDLWDPKANVPDNVRSVFKPIDTKLPGVQFTELLPKLAEQIHRATLIRSLSYTPIGLFNHTAAIYQMLTGYNADNVSPSGQLEPPSPKDFPNFGSNIVKLKPLQAPMLPFVMMPRPLQESNVIGKAGTAGFLGRAYDPYYLYPSGDDMDMAKMERVRVDDLTLRQDVPLDRLQRRASLRDTVSAGMKNLDRAVNQYALNEYYEKALSLVLSGKAREAFNLSAETPELREKYGNNTFGQSCLLARRLVERQVRLVTVNWERDDAYWDTHAKNFSSLKQSLCPNLDTGFPTLLDDLAARGLLDETLVVWLGEFGRTPQINANAGRDHWAACNTVVLAGAGLPGGTVYGSSDPWAAYPATRPVTPDDLTATIYHLLGIDSRQTLLDPLGRPHQLCHGEPLWDLL